MANVIPRNMTARDLAWQWSSISGEKGYELRNAKWLDELLKLEYSPTQILEAMYTAVQSGERHFLGFHKNAHDWVKQEKLDADSLLVFFLNPSVGAPSCFYVYWDLKDEEFHTEESAAALAAARRTLEDWTDEHLGYTAIVSGSVPAVRSNPRPRAARAPDISRLDR